MLQPTLKNVIVSDFRPPSQRLEIGSQQSWDIPALLWAQPFVAQQDFVSSGHSNFISAVLHHRSLDLTLETYKHYLKGEFSCQSHKEIYKLNQHTAQIE